jgi:hypothetical protein
MNDTPSPVPSLFAALELALNTLIDARVQTHMQEMHDRIGALEKPKAGESLDTAGMVDLESDEFQQAVRVIAKEEAEEAVSDHTSEYDHDEFMDDDAVQDKVNDLLSGATVEITV